MLKKTVALVLVIVVSMTIGYGFGKNQGDDKSKTETTALVPEETEGESKDIVWVTESGEKYHVTSKCSNMKHAYQLSCDEAEEKGYEPCKRCYS